MLKALVFAFFPSWLGVPLRRLLGHSLAQGAHIGIGSLVFSKEIELGENASIDSFAVVRAQNLKLGKEARVRSFSFLNCHTIILGQYVHISPSAVVSGSQLPKSKLIVGDHSRIFPFCWLEPGEGIFLGKNVGVGGHNLIFTHGSWSDYLNGGPMGAGPVTIEDNVWLPWRITVLSGVTLGKNSVVMSGSTVTRSIPEGSIAGGSPAKVIKAGGPTGLPDDQKVARALEILKQYQQYLFQSGHYGAQLQGLRLNAQCAFQVDSLDGLKRGDLVVRVSESAVIDRAAALANGISVLDHPTQSFFPAAKQKDHDDFISFIRFFGIRLYRHEAVARQRRLHAALDSALSPT